MVPESGLLGLGDVAALHRLLDSRGLQADGNVHVDQVLGVPGGMLAAPSRPRAPGPAPPRWPGRTAAERGAVAGGEIVSSS